MKKSIILSILTMALMLTGNLFVSAQGNMDMSKKDKMNSKTMVSDMDKDFANMAAMGGDAEIKWADLAMQKSTNSKVKKYAAKMKKDHMKAGDDLKKVAMKNNLTLPMTMNDEQMQMTSQLEAATGADFDKMYIQMAGVEAHHKMEQLFVDESTNGTDKDLVNFARKTLSTVQTHLQMAQDMSKMMSSMDMKSNK